MIAEELLRAGRLDDALKALQEQVRSQPSNATLRIFLFQLLAVMGQWTRALNQLKVVGELDASALPRVQTYSTAIECEALRRVESLLAQALGGFAMALGVQAQGLQQRGDPFRRLAED
ncbi:tetratricopeptide repeat protein, partial [Pseudomonas aeruginosa]|uniref:tetratricopeptide repeat protein n=1 Tax=Pseudomonas aeruginosa TaxID=287 RepID=UPI0022383C53